MTGSMPRIITSILQSSGPISTLVTVTQLKVVRVTYKNSKTISLGEILEVVLHYKRGLPKFRRLCAGISAALHPRSGHLYNPPNKTFL